MQKYLVLLQVDNIQDYIFDFLKSEQNSKTLRKVKNQSGTVKELTEVNNLGKKEKSKFMELLDDVRIESIELNPSGKVYFILNQENKNKLESNICQQYYSIGVELIYMTEEINEKCDKSQAYKSMNERLKEPQKKAEILTIISKKSAHITFQKASIKGASEIQSTGKLLENYRYKSKDKERDNNQIAIIKADLNGIGEFFKLKSLDEVSKISSGFESIITSLENKKDNAGFFPLYIAGDDIFYISKISEILTVVKEIEDMLSILNTEYNTKFTVGIGVLTTDYRNIIRYYYNRVEEFMNRAKILSKQTKNNVICINGIEMTIPEFRDVFHFMQTTGKKGNSKLHNVLQLLEKEEVTESAVEREVLKLEQVYILTREQKEAKALYTYLANQILEKKLTATHLRLYALLRKNIDKSNKKSNLFISNKSLKQKIKNYMQKTGLLITKDLETFIPNLSKGFWFRLEQLIIDDNVDLLKKFFANYQHQNKLLLSYIQEVNAVLEETDVEKMLIKDERKVMKECKYAQRDQMILEKANEFANDVIQNKKQYQLLIRKYIILNNMEENQK